MPELVDICKVSDIPIAEARMILVNDAEFGMFNASVPFFAISPHAGASLLRGIVEGDIFRCRNHHWRFCFRNGTNLDEMKPCCNVLNYRMRVVSEKVQIELDNASLMNCNPKQDRKPT